jgi:hypothetical protein
MIPIMGSLFFCSMVNSFLPFANLGLFIYDRSFYSGDSASKLYPPRCLGPKLKMNLPTHDQPC